MNKKMYKFCLVFCSVFCVSQILFNQVFASINDIDLVGGAYEDVLNAKNDYYNSEYYDGKDYECHHLIAKEALNRWGDVIIEKNGINQFNEFITDDLYQNWAPSITMEKRDHELTRSYYSGNQRQRDNALRYIDYQASNIINNGDIMGVLKEEINFIKHTFGNKYDRGISEVYKYTGSLEFRHENGNTLYMRNPANSRWFFRYKFK